MSLFEAISLLKNFLKLLIHCFQLAEDMQYFANEEDNLSIPRISLPVLMYCASHEKTSDLSPTQVCLFCYFVILYYYIIDYIIHV